MSPRTPEVGLLLVGEGVRHRDKKSETFPPRTSRHHSSIILTSILFRRDAVSAMHRFVIGRIGNLGRNNFVLILEWTRGMWADCENVNSPVSLGLFKGEKKVNTSKNHFHSVVCEWR